MLLPKLLLCAISVHGGGPPAPHIAAGMAGACHAPHLLQPIPYMHCPSAMHHAPTNSQGCAEHALTLGEEQDGVSLSCRVFCLWQKEAEELFGKRQNIAGWLIWWKMLFSYKWHTWKAWIKFPLVGLQICDEISPLDIATEWRDVNLLPFWTTQIKLFIYSEENKYTMEKVKSKIPKIPLFFFFSLTSEEILTFVYLFGLF